MRLLSNAPVLDEGCMRLVRAYADLGTCRAIGMVMGPIPVTAIWEWCDRKGLEPNVAEHAERVIRLVDSIILGRQVKPKGPTPPKERP